MADLQLPNTLARELMEIRRRLSDLERSPRNSNSSLSGDSSLTVYDNAGIRRVRLGALPDGTYGLGLFDGSGALKAGTDDLVGLSTPQVAQVLDEEHLDALTNPWPSFSELPTPGPDVTVDVSQNGRLLVTISATLTAHQAAPDVGAATPAHSLVEAPVAMSVALSGANVRPASLADSLSLSVTLSHDVTGEALNFATQMTASRTLWFTDLEPGPTTITAQYADGSLAEATFANRTVVAQSY